jgi:tetratricopeptide (TPR) repeat protein
MPQSLTMTTRLLAALLLVPSLAAADALEDGKALLKKRDYKNAIVQLDAAAKTDATGEAMYCLAIAYEFSGDAAKAIETYKKVVEGKGKRAADAERYQKALEAMIAEASTVERARLEFERAGLESSTRLKEARDRIEKADRTINERERDVQAKERERGTENAVAEEAKRIRERAEAAAFHWRQEALASPAGHGKLLRALGTASFALAGIGIGASVWYGRTASVATTEINQVTGLGGGAWTDELEWYSNWGPRADARLPYTITAGAGLFLVGAVVLGLGEAAADNPDETERATATPERSP